MQLSEAVPFWASEIDPGLLIESSVYFSANGVIFVNGIIEEEIYEVRKASDYRSLYAVDSINTGEWTHFTFYDSPNQK